MGGWSVFSDDAMAGVFGLSSGVRVFQTSAQCPFQCAAGVPMERRGRAEGVAQRVQQLSVAKPMRIEMTFHQGIDAQQDHEGHRHQRPFKFKGGATCGFAA